MKQLLFGFLILSTCLIGCGGGALPPQANPDDAKAALITALEAWKKGETTESLAGRAKPIYFNDIKDRPGVKLLGFSIIDGHEFYGQSVRLSVVLTFEFPDGETQEKKINYLIDTKPATVIVPG